MKTAKKKASPSKKAKVKYIDGFLIALPKKNLTAYKKMSQMAGKIWKEYGALEYKECYGDDLNIKMGAPFPSLLKLKNGETAIFSWIAYRNKKQRDSVNAKIMKDPRLANCMDMNNMPFEIKRMSMGGFSIFVDMI